MQEPRAPATESSRVYRSVMPACIIALVSFVSVAMPQRDGRERPARVLETASSVTVSIVTASSDGRLVAAGGFDGAIVVWETTTWRRLASLPVQRSKVEALRFSEDGTILYTADINGRVAAIDLARFVEVRSIKGLARPGQYGHATSAFSNDGSLVAIAKQGRIERRRTHVVEVYSTGTCRKLWKIAVPRTWAVSFLRFTPDGEHLLVGPYNDEVRAYIVRTGTVVWTLQGVSTASKAVDVSAEAGEGVVPNAGQLLVRFDYTNGARKGVVDFGTPVGVQGVALDSAGRFIATTDSAARVRLWDRRSGQLVKDIIAFEVVPFQLAFVNGKDVLVTTSGSSKLYVFDVSPYVTPVPEARP